MQVVVRQGETKKEYIYKRRSPWIICSTLLRLLLSIWLSGLYAESTPNVSILSQSVNISDNFAGGGSNTSESNIVLSSSTLYYCTKLLPSPPPTKFGKANIKHIENCDKNIPLAPTSPFSPPPLSGDVSRGYIYMIWSKLQRTAYDWL